MPRAMWSGSVGFGLVNVPVKMYTAARSKDIHFNQLRKSDMSRVRMKRVAESDGEDVGAEDIIKGYDVGGGEYVVVTQDELDQLAPEMTSGIEIEEFVELPDIDPVYFENSYYLVPDKTGKKAYALLLEAMRQANKVALGRVVMRNKQYLVAIRPAGKALAMSTLYYPDEVTSQDELDGLPEGDVKASEREVQMAEQLILALSGPFEPEKYQDEYREKLMSLIEDKAAGNTIVQMPAPKEKAAPAVDLMKALEASIAAAKSKKSA
jgi:DNA end-binding protein Ku